MILPNPIAPGDTIAVCAPAGAVRPELFAPAIDAIESRGFHVKIMPNAMGRHGSYSATARLRLKDMTDALLDPEVKAIMCGRGGYGAVALLPDLEYHVNACNPKWLIGFSDITALHALWRSKGIASVHASMLKGIAEDATSLTDRLFGILQGYGMSYDFDTYPLNKSGIVRGNLWGGNLSVLGGLIGTPYVRWRKGDILLIEDINEPIYKIERILWQLKLAGILPDLGGLIVGDFTGTKADANYDDPYEMVAEMIAQYDFPAAFGIPVGHIIDNHPLLLGPCSLSISQHSVSLYSV